MDRLSVYFNNLYDELAHKNLFWLQNFQILPFSPPFDEILINHELSEQKNDNICTIVLNIPKLTN